MPNVSEIMTTDVQVISPEKTLRDAAVMMQTLEVGALPVCAGSRVLGVLTDRDIIVRGLALGLHPDTACVSDVMSTDLHLCSAEQDVEEVMRTMGDQQIRRVPVIDADGNLVGIVSLGDLALRQRGHIDETVREISARTPEDPS
jgi:CBS domain-containing protein